MKFIATLVMVVVFCLATSTLLAQSPAWNLDFEEWDSTDTTPGLWHDTTVVADRVGLFPPKWYFRPDHIPERTGLARTTDATAGEYAVALSGYYQYQVMRIISGESAEQPGWPIDFRPNYLIGDYKAILLGDCDSLRTYVDIYLTENNGATNDRDTIGQASLVLKESSTYVPFELEIDYTNDTAIPDTVIIILAKERFGFDVPPDCLECSHVFFDNLKLETVVSTKQPNLLEQEVIVFPNPAKKLVYIQSNCVDCQFNITVINLNGQIVKRIDMVSNDIAMSTTGMASGLYFINIIEVTSGRRMSSTLVIE